MKYSISEIANLLGISIVAVRNYEKCGLIEPERNEQNNYREYNAIDLNLIRRARSYMSYGFSLNEATDILRDRDLSGVADALREKERSIEERLKQEYQLLQFTKRHAEYLRRISVSEGEFAIELSPAFYGLPYREGVQISEDKALHEKIRLWNDIRPFAETLLVYHRRAFECGESRYQSGLCIEERYAPFFRIEEGEHVRYYPSRKAVHTVVCHNFEPDRDENSLNFAQTMKWIRQKGYVIADDPIGRVLHTSQSTGRWIHHIEIWVPIE